MSDWKMVPVTPTHHMVSTMMRAADAGCRDTLIYAAALTAAPSPWQPIETAPIEGKVLLVNASGHRIVGCWGDYRVHNIPSWTHWMRLPEPPK